MQTATQDAQDAASLRIALTPATTAAAAPTATPSVSLSSPSLALSESDRRLFCTQHVDELRRMAEDKRNASEDKKEELRQLVGIRYRVLIETADSILTMHSIVDDSTAKLRALHDSLPSLSLGGASAAALTPDSALNGGITQMQLLLLLRQYALSATSIWDSLDAHDYASALQMVLRMRSVHAQISSLEHYPLDAQCEHPEVARLVDHAAAGSSNGAAAVLPSLAAFFAHHAAYHRDLPLLIASQAVTRLSRERSLSPQRYSDIFLALSLLLQPSSPSPASSLGLELLDLFLDVRRAQIADLVSSAAQALVAFRAGPAQAAPILVHALSEILLALQYTLTDVALLFSSTNPALNPHAKLVSATGALQAQWKTTNVAERVRAFWTSCSNSSGSAGEQAKAAAATSAAVASVTVDAGRLAAKTAAWLSSLQSFLSEALLSKLLPFLLPSSKQAAGSGAGGCVALQRLRDEILRVANFEDERSLAREGAKDEEQAETARREKESSLGAALARRRDSLSRSEEDYKKSAAAAPADESKSNGGATAEASPAPAAAAAADQAKLPAMRRKRLMERWEESCTLLFGARSAAAALVASSAAASPSSSVASFAAPLSLFDAFFFAPLSSFTLPLIEGSFERLTLLDRMEEIMAQSSAAGTGSATATTSAKDKETNGKLSAKDAQSASGGKIASKSKAKGKAVEADSIDDEFGLSALRKSVLSPTLPTTHASAPAATDLNGEREAAVQSIVVVFRRELRKLARECKAVLVCKYTAPSAPSSAVSSSSKREIVPILFPALGRYLLDELTPQLTRKYNQLVERCIDGLKKRLGELEREVMGAMGDVALWRSDSTRALVHQSVFIGRVCSELRKQTKLMSLESLLASNSAASTPRGAAPSGASNPLYFSLSLTSKTAFRVWSRYLAASLAEDFALAFDSWAAGMTAMTRLGDKHAQSYYAQQASNRNTAAGTAGGAVPLGLLLPVHASPSIFQLLFQLHHEYYLLLGFRPHADILSWLLTDVVSALLAVWESKLLGLGGEHPSEPVLPQLGPNAMMQAMFDFQIMFAVLRLPASSSAGAVAGKTVSTAAPVDPSTDARARYAALQSAFDARCVSLLDQIDWVTSRASFHANVGAAIARSGMLFGLLTKSNPLPAVVPPAGAAGVSSSTPAAAAGGFSFDAAASGSTVAASAAASVNLLPLAAPVPRILPVTASLYPSLIPTVAAPKSLPSSLVLTSGTSYTSASHSSTGSAASASAAAAAAAASAAAASTAASAPAASSSSSVGLSLSSFGAQLNLSALGGQKAVAELGTSLLGKLSASALWGSAAGTTATTTAAGRK